VFDLGEVLLVTIERTDDLFEVQKIVRHPQVFHFRSLCDGITQEAFTPPPGLYLLAKDETGPLGIFFFQVQNPVLYQVHAAFLPEAWGPKTLKAARLGIAWLAENTLCKKLMALIPAFNDPALAYVQRIGGRIEGKIHHGAQKDGWLVPEYVYGITVE
jgi:hypothetical protein